MKFFDLEMDRATRVALFPQLPPTGEELEVLGAQLKSDDSDIRSDVLWIVSEISLGGQLGMSLEGVALRIFSWKDLLSALRRGEVEATLVPMVSLSPSDALVPLPGEDEPPQVP